MIKSDEIKKSYIRHLMFWGELKEMLVRDFHLDLKKSFSCDETVFSHEKPPVISTEIIEKYICRPINSEPFEINIRNLMIEEDAVNKIQVISDIYFPENFSWPIITNEEEHKLKKLNCFTGGNPSFWNQAALTKKIKYHFTDTYYLAYRESHKGKQYEIVQFSNFDPNRTIEYIINTPESFEVNLNHCDEVKWEGKNNSQYSLKKDKNGIYRLY